MAANNPVQSWPSYGPEYTIYTFDRSHGARMPSQWQRHETLREIQSAQISAHALFASGRYARIEIRQRYFDKRANRTVDVMLESIGGRKKMKLGALFVIVFAAFCGFTVLAAAAFLG